MLCVLDVEVSVGVRGGETQHEKESFACALKGLSLSRLARAWAKRSALTACHCQRSGSRQQRIKQGGKSKSGRPRAAPAPQ